MFVEYLRNQARDGDGAASGGGLGFGPFAAHLGRGFEHLQLEVRDVESSHAQAGDFGEAQAAGTCDVHHGPPAVRQRRRQSVELLGAEGDYVGPGCLGQLDAPGGEADQQLGVDGGVERGS
jgi:hypothetical protein